MDLMAGFPREHRLKGVLYDNPSIVLAIVVAYVLFVLKIGPDYMRDRKPFNIKTIARIYNVAQVLANVWFVGILLSFALRYRNTGRIQIPCMVPTYLQADLEGEGDTELLAFTSTFYLIVRMLDFLDTVMFVLTKKFTHVSFLHVYHHIVAVFTGYIYLRSGWALVLAFGVVINANIHIVMYSYYFLATFPSMRPYLWWKRYLTMAQIVQFATIGVHVLWITFDNCGYPKVLTYYNVIQVSLFLILFANFYIQNYIKGQSPSNVKAYRSKSE